MSLTHDHLRRMARVSLARTLSFVELVGLAELDPGTAFRGAILRGDMSGQVLDGFDFTGAEFRGCNLIGADIRQALGITAAMLASSRWDETTLLPRALFWADGIAPSWADDWGRDQYGLWVTFSIPATDGTRVTQRLRWCPPGEFRMGSPPDEPGRFDNEGRRHLVTLAEGFWLFDTPCTQSLWQAVMGANPSEFQSPDRPVEQVDFAMVQDFLYRLNRLVPDLNLALPSEAQWEYACRAGTDTATYAGPMEILAERHAPVLDTIAWYGGNSGQDFELDNGFDASGWPGKQYDDARAGTHPVGRKRANAWGLHDMLGNVWEWCADPWHASYERASADGLVWPDEGGAAGRVIRGGSWDSEARDVRSACRARSDPAARDVNLGFRCARVQATSEALPAAEGGEEQAQRAERGAATTGPERRR